MSMSDAAPKITIARAVDYLLGRNKQIMEKVKLFASDLEQVIVSGSRVEGAGAKVIAGGKK